MCTPGYPAALAHTWGSTRDTGTVVTRNGKASGTQPGQQEGPSCGFFPPCKGVGAWMSLGNKGLAFSRGGTARVSRHTAEVGAAPQGTVLPGRGEGRGTQPPCTSASASPRPSTTHKAEAVVVLFQSTTKTAFILSGDATFRFAVSVSVLRLAVCVHLVRAHLYRENQKWETVL